MLGSEPDADRSIWIDRCIWIFLRTRSTWSSSSRFNCRSNRQIFYELLGITSSRIPVYRDGSHARLLPWSIRVNAGSHRPKTTVPEQFCSARKAYQQFTILPLNGDNVIYWMVTTNLCPCHLQGWIIPRWAPGIYTADCVRVLTA